MIWDVEADNWQLTCNDAESWHMFHPSFPDFYTGTKYMVAQAIIFLIVTVFD